MAILLSKKGLDVTLWGAFPEYVEAVRRTRESVKFLPGIRIPDGVRLTSSIDEATNGKELVVLATPSQFMRGVLEKISRHKPGTAAFVSVAKGIENSTLKCMSEVISDCLGGVAFAALSGPTIALEVAKDLPTTAVVASKDEALAREIRDVFMTDRFRVYSSTDVIGVEVGGSVKNIIAIAAGALDGLGYGTNAKAALLTRGLVEIVRLGVAMGGCRETFYGLSGLGDLATTCVSRYSRNRWFGEEIGKGKKMRDILSQTDMVVEGVLTAKSAYELSKKHKVEMPITSEVYRVLYENKDPKRAVHDLMTRSPKGEEE